MNRRYHLAIMCLVFALLAVLAGADPSYAGPGGGTYYANSPASGVTGTALRKFVDSLPGLGFANRNNLGQYIPVAIPDKTTFPGSDYYVIELKEYLQRMHSDLPKATRLRGYRQVNTTDTTVKNVNQYLGPLIIGQENRPVRIQFVNSLPTGTAGNLFIPVDTSLMGAGLGPLGAAGGNYTQNRATLHLHGGNTPWISDGTPHQWTVPAGETTPYKKGVSTKDVPDMPASGNGKMTFFWPNQQSSRLMFYHDHAYGITRLNVYAGEAAGYLLTDATEEGLINNGTLPNICGAPASQCVYRYGIPLVIQDKTFVPQNIAVQDSKWDTTKWGTYGDLWFPHVYEANQDPYSPEGANPFGRWDYGPWFWPPVNIDPANSVLPDPSVTPEAFMDTPIVNGTAYPYLPVQPRAYRFRILNACNDRTLNLSLFYADPADPTGKDVKMVPASFDPSYPADWPVDGRDGGVPDPATVGPNMIQIGSEGGLMPNPVVIPNRPIGYDYNRRNIVVLNTLYRALMLGPAERADVIIDFSSVPPGSKLILYNDGPAPNPAFDSRYDYYTADPDQSSSGGAPSTIVGYGPNTRTIMQFQVAGAPSAPYNMAPLQTRLPAAFAASQPAPVVPETVFNNAYGNTITNDLYSKISDYSFTFTPLGGTIPSTIQFRSKAIQELWDPYGRMNATLGVELPFTTNLNQTTVPMGYAEPATEFLMDGQPQIWKITHNGVDTHPVHFHLFNVQLINRVGWDGAIRPPDDNEYGWKETVRMNPLEDAIVAVLPLSQTLPFALPTSSRLLDPTQPAGAPITTTDVTVSPPVAMTVSNSVIDYGFEYVWHCHILGHEENDFMRPMIFRVPSTVPPAPTGLTAVLSGQTSGTITNTTTNQVVLTWTDNANNEASFRVERATGNSNTYTALGTVQFISVAVPSFTDTTVNSNTTYKYRVFAFNKQGDSTQSNIVTTKTPVWSKATGLTLTPNKPSPHYQGTNVLFTALATGPTKSMLYHYRFSLTSGATTTVEQDYSPMTTWALPDTAPTGTYTVTVNATSGGALSPPPTPDITKSMQYVVIVPPIPIGAASPVAGIYSGPTVTVTLSANVPANIYYTTNGTVPTTLSTKYTTPLALSTSTTINFIAIDANGSASVVNTATYIINVPDLVANMTINGGVVSTNTTTVTLQIYAIDPAGVKSVMMSNDGVTYSAEVNYDTYPLSVIWNLAAGPDGPRTVYVKVRDNAAPTGTVYSPISATITLDTMPPVMNALPLPGTYAAGASPLSVTLTSNEPSTTIYYTTNGSTPTTGSTVYIAPILVGVDTTINYFGVDLAGNPSLVSSGSWTFDNGTDITGSVSINNGAPTTNNVNVTLSLLASDPTHSITAMSISNDGSLWSTMTYSTGSPWILTGGDGVKNVYVKFTDAVGTQSGAFTASTVLVTGAPHTTALPVPGIYNSAPVVVTLTPSNPLSTIYYTTDLSVPTTGSTVYTGPLSLNATTTINYFAVDIANNAELYSSGTWTISPSDLVASVSINNGAAVTSSTTVNLQLSAVDPAGVSTMQFSNDGTTWSSEEAYAATKSWIMNPGDGVKTVYVQFRDASLPAPGFQYPPVTANIKLDTTPPFTTASPVAGFYSYAPAVTLTANEQATIYYTTDGTTPTTFSPVYTTPILVTAATATASAVTTIKYFAVDLAGNPESIKTGIWTAGANDMTASVMINSGASLASSPTVTLTLTAVDPAGVDTMQFSYDNINFTAEEPYNTTKVWPLTPGDSLKTVYVRFRDASNGGNGNGFQYPPFSASITLDTTPPATSASPVPGSYSAGPVLVALAASEPSTIYYTTDGSTPTLGSSIYTGPIPVDVSNRINYFAVDLAGNVEPVIKTGTWSVHVEDMTASIIVGDGSGRTNNTTVTLGVSAYDSTGVSTMQFSNDGITYSAEEPYGVTKTWALTPGDGTKTVYVRFRDNALPTGELYPPITANVVLDAVAPVTTAGPVAGFYASPTVNVTLLSNEPSTIYYTVDGSTPNTGSAVYSGPILVNAATTIKYFGVDAAGNVEAIKSGTWNPFVDADLSGSIQINTNAAVTNNPVVTLSLLASDPSCSSGVATMQFSNDGANFSPEETYNTTKTWALSSGEGLKYVYVRYRDCALPTGIQYAPLASSILLDTTPPATTASPGPGSYSLVPFSVSLVSNETTKIYYTTDGSTPTTGSPVYAGPIAIPVSTNTTINYFAVDAAGNTESSVKTGTWTAYPDGNLGSGGTVADALKAMLIAQGLIAPTPSDILHGDVAPLVAGKPNPDGKIDVGDVVVLLRKALGLVTW